MQVKDAAAEVGSDGLWPDGRRFAFTIVDDTDNATLENVAPFYAALSQLGVRTTKTVWSLPTPRTDPFYGDGLENAAYRTWLHALERDGFEIGWHGARSGGSKRPDTELGLTTFRKTFGTWPATYANHARNRECVYWGHERFDSLLVREAYRLARGRRSRFYGSARGNEYCWSDLCATRIRYVRGFTFDSIVTSEADPWMPYYDARRPDVRAWFSSTNAADVEAFVRLMARRNLDRLERSGGACIVYTHAAAGFVREGQLDARVRNVLSDVAERNGWFVPARTLLGHLETQRGLSSISRGQHQTLERRFLRDKLLAPVRRRLPTRDGHD